MHNRVTFSNLGRGCRSREIKEERKAGRVPAKMCARWWCVVQRRWVRWLEDGGASTEQSVRIYSVMKSIVAVNVECDGRVGGQLRVK